jgi:hypothetical protein
VRHRVPDRRDHTRLGEPRLTTLGQECAALGAQGIAREKNDPLAQRGILTGQDGIECWPVQTPTDLVVEFQPIDIIDVIL